MRRTDQMSVFTDDGFVWDSMSEVSISGGPGATQEDFELSTGRLTMAQIETLMRRVGKPIFVLATKLDQMGVAEEAMGIHGVVSKLSLSPYDANDSDLMIDRISISPVKVVQL